MPDSLDPQVPTAASARERILLSAYACEPGKGSEPGTGWNLAMRLAQHFDVTVLTRSNNRCVIEQAIAKSNAPQPAFIYHDLPPALRFLKRKGILTTQVYYAIWQRSIGRQIPRLCDLRAFDLFHHLTFNSFEVMPGLLAKFPGIKVWGPIGGGQQAPVPLIATFHLKDRIKERLRSLRITLSKFNPRLIKQLESCDLVLFANQETQDLFESVNFKSCVQMIDVGVDANLFTPSKKSEDGRRIFSAGNFEARKGTRLLLLAFQQAYRKNPKLRLRLAGDGPDLPREKAWVQANRLSGVIEFPGRRSHGEMAREFKNADVFVFPSIRDTSGAIVLEAMASGLPIVCLDHQGAKIMVADDCGIRIKPTTLPHTIQGIADAILRLSSSRQLRETQGHKARERILSEFTWEKKSGQMAKDYRTLIEGTQRVIH